MSCTHPDHAEGQTCEDRAVGCASDCRCCIPRAKCRGCSNEATEASGYCFDCAEELACMLQAEGLDPSTAWKAPRAKPKTS